MPDVSIFYALLLIFSFFMGMIAYGVHYAIEESSIITLRLRILLLFAFAIGLPVYCYFIFDAWHYQGLSFNLISYPLDDTHYYLLLLVFAAITLYRFFRYTQLEDVVFLALTALFLLRFFVVTTFSSHVYFWIFFFFIYYYGVFIIRSWTPHFTERLFLLVLLGVFTWALLFLVVDNFRASGNYMTYLSCIFVATLWIRYMWNLEYKRRKRCQACGGWGKLGMKGETHFWWAVGHKERSSSKLCDKCKGKGWVYRYPDLFHVEK